MWKYHLQSDIFQKCNAHHTSFLLHPILFSRGSLRCDFFSCYVLKGINTLLATWSKEPTFNCWTFLHKQHCCSWKLAFCCFLKIAITEWDGWPDPGRNWWAFRLFQHALICSLRIGLWGHWWRMHRGWNQSSAWPGPEPYWSHQSQCNCQNRQTMKVSYQSYMPR